ncbi:hypothetical protein R1sor_010997 [Riccia sorocarpa]|uniref:Uncharacterized protein n=1 Tax=Riccia sorocarpa TaxID=122646 RepID=A0ABD3I0X5_9MARC
MWCPMPKPKVIPRPKPVFTHEYLRRRKTNSKFNNKGDADEQQEKENLLKQQQYDPHRHKRHFGVRHTDVTRIFLVDYHKCPSQVQSDQPHGLKKTDITCYLEKVVPSHAVPQPNTNTNVQQFQSTPRNNSSNIAPPHQQKKDSTSDARRIHQNQAPSRGETRERRIKHQGSRENPRPETALTGEMRRLSVTNAGTGNFPEKPIDHHCVASYCWQASACTGITRLWESAYRKLLPAAREWL